MTENAAIAKDNMPEQKTKLRRRFKRFLLVIPVAALLYFSAFIAVIHLYGTVDSAAEADVIIALGAGLRRDGRPGPALTRRSQQAAALWREGFAPLVLCTGGQAENYPRSEASACREILLAQGLPAAAILLEERSRSTEENAIYSRQVLDELGLTSVVLVSDGYHMLRAGWLFRQRGFEPYLSPVPVSRMRQPLDYPRALLREFLAFHWQFFKQIFQIPVTHISGI